MNGDPLLSCRIKIDRAIKHFNDLTAENTAFGALNPYRILREEDSVPSMRVYRVNMIQPIPDPWSAIVGDIIHNLKSTLDSLAASLVIRAGHTSKTALKETYFPIRGAESGLADEKASAFFRRAGGDVEKIIRRLQPYRDGKGHPLWQLNQLNIIDKHRRIIAAYGDLMEIQVSHLPFPTTPAATLPFNNAPFPLKEGDELLRVAFWEPHYDSHAHFVFQVSFNEPEIAEREALIPTLSQFINFVQRLVFIFEKRFF